MNLTDHSSRPPKRKASEPNLSLVPEKVEPGTLADLMTLAGADFLPRNEQQNVTKIYIHKTVLYPDGLNLRPINDCITLDNTNNRIIARDFQGTSHSDHLTPVMMKLINALLNNDTKTITKRETEAKGQKWSTCMSKYLTINKICHCNLITIAGINSLRLNLAAIPVFLSKDGKF